jgi:D-arabinose 1-dehydrogenase-like Zn-dependent alcohol dehydrogenase
VHKETASDAATPVGLTEACRGTKHRLLKEQFMSSVDTLIDRQTTDAGEDGVMKALVYHGRGKRAWEPKPKPTIRERGDAIVRITTSTICGTDLHILKGDVPSVTPGRILGHEGVGVIEAVGPSVSSFHVGELVLISCITACGICDFCRRRMPSHCRTGGWILGNTIDGTQAEYVRIPHADTSLYRVSPDLDMTSRQSSPDGAGIRRDVSRQQHD